MNKETDWRLTERYNPGLGNGTPVERVQLGYAKMVGVEEEKLASDLAKLIPVPVPHVEIVRAVQGQGPCAISYLRGPSSHYLAAKGDYSQQDYPDVVRAALKLASGLLPFLAWIGADDHHDDTNLVVDELEKGLFHVVAIDFETAFAWKDGEEHFDLHLPPGLIANVDPPLVTESLAIIERLSPAQIRGRCDVFEHVPDSRRQRIERVLQLRQPLLREPLAARGWLT